MKATGIVRKVDELGRIVIPKELRSVMGMTEGAPLEIFVHGNSIILKKYQTDCVFCGNDENLKRFMDKLICPQCLKTLRK